MTSDNTYTIYVLKLMSDKYYIGKTKRSVNERLAEHLSGQGSQWTKLYPPLEIIEQQLGDALAEESMTLKYMMKYSIEQVRGGSWTQIKFPKTELDSLQKRIASLQDRCYKCNNVGHFAKFCPRPSVTTVAPNVPIGVDQKKQTTAEKEQSVADGDWVAVNPDCPMDATNSDSSFYSVAKQIIELVKEPFVQKRIPKKFNKFENQCLRFKKESQQTGKKMCWRCGFTNHTDSSACFAKEDRCGRAL
jgi:predicted GIY-YIG superfamily endonuclease